MAAFDAGSIESTLTLDRSPWIQGLRIARQQAREFEQDGIEVRLDVDATALDVLRREIDRLSGRDIEIDVDVNSASLDALRRELDRLELRSIGIDIDLGNSALPALLAELRALDGYTINVDVDTSSAIASLAFLEFELRRLDGYTINIDVDTGAAAASIAALLAELAALRAAASGIDVGGGLGGGLGKGLGGAGGGGEAAGGLMLPLILVGLVTLLPVLVASVASLAAVLGGLLAALTAVAGGVGVLALGIVPAVMGMMKGKEEITKLTDKLSKLDKGSKEYAETAHELAHAQEDFNSKYGPAAAAMKELSAAWKDWQKQTEGPALKIVAAVLNVVADILPRLVPIFTAFSNVLSDAMGGLGRFVNGPEMDRVVQFFSVGGSAAFSSLLGILGNLMLMFGRLGEAFLPFGNLILDGLERMTAGWAEWADGIGESQGFKDFIAYVVDVGPRLLDMLGSIWDAFGNISDALKPLSGPIIDGITGFFRWISEIDPEIITAITIALGGMGVALLAVAVAMGVIALLSSPIALLVVGIGILIGVLVYLWRTNDEARAFMVAAWEAIQAKITQFKDWFIAEAWPVIQQVFAWLMEKGGQFRDWFVNDVWPVIQAKISQFKDWFVNEAWPVIKRVFDWLIEKGGEVVGWVRRHWDEISAKFREAWETISGIVRGAWTIISSIISGGFEIIRGIFRVVAGFIRGDWGQMWEGIKGIAKGAWEVIWGIVRGAFQVLVSIFNAGGVVEWFKGLPGRISGALGDLGSTLSGAGRRLIDGLLGGIREKFDGVRRTLGELTSMLPDWKGPAETDKKLLRPAGQMLIEGLIGGLDSRVSALRATLRGITTDIEAQVTIGAMGRVAPAPAGESASLGGGSQTIQVNMEVYNPVAEPTSETASREMTRLGYLGVFA